MDGILFLLQSVLKVIKVHCIVNMKTIP